MIVDFLCSLGFTKNESVVLNEMLSEKEYTQRELERACDLRQPEVSVALKLLNIKKFVEISNQVINKNKSGRPVFKFKILRNKHYIIGRFDSIVDKNYRDSTDKYQENKISIQKIVDSL